MMKTLLLTMAVVMSATMCDGQIRRGRPQLSAQQLREMQEYDEHNQRLAQEYEKDKETGRDLFGVDERWGQRKFAGTLTTPNDFKRGDWGRTQAQFRAINKVSATEYLVLAKYKGAEAMLLRGFDMSKVTDGAEFVVQYPIVIQNTFNYTSVADAQKTVLVLERNDKKVDELAEAASYRNWTVGKDTFLAKFIESKNGNASLQRKDNGEESNVALYRLSKDDREWIRDEMKLRTDEKKAAAAAKKAQSEPIKPQRKKRARR